MPDPLEAKANVTNAIDQEIQRLLESTPTLRDKLLFGLMYATGIRVSEVVRLRYRDFDFERRTINIWQGKGRKDRLVVLPRTFEAMLKEMSTKASSKDFLFPGERVGKHISPRTLQRAMKRGLEIAKITKPATPHSLRHSFACHSFENGCDIRSIQKLLGHTKLETTTIYVKVAQPKDPDAIQSPLDAMNATINGPAAQQPKRTTPAVGKLRLHLKPLNDCEGAKECKVTLSISTSNGPTIYLTGIVARESRPSWITLEIPALEHWEEPMRWLTREQRERILEPRFFELLQREIPKQFRKLQFSN